LPAAQQADPAVQELASWGCSTTMHVAHLVAPRLDNEDHTKDIDFTAAGILARRQAGYADTMDLIARAPWEAPLELIEGVVEHH
jgi:NTE family protein